ncbi:MAG: AzlD domain-containing protein [Bacillota bacterium]|nr:AzlD domain-containing protein [Bacillota bacterium]
MASYLVSEGPYGRLVWLVPQAKPEVLAIIAGMFAVTYFSRAAPLLALSRVQMPLWLRRWLSHVPVAVLAALAASSVLVSDGKLALHGGNVYLIAAVPTLVVAARTKSLLLSVVVGMCCVTALRAFGIGAGAG